MEMTERTRHLSPVITAAAVHLPMNYSILSDPKAVNSF